MNEIDPMYHLVRTMLDNREMVFFLGAGASMEGTKDGLGFPSFSTLIENVLKKWGNIPENKEDRLRMFFTIIEEWKNQNRLSRNLKNFLKGEPGSAHYYLAALSIALFGKSNAMLYLTTNYDNLINKAFSGLENNTVHKFEVVSISIRPRITGSDFLSIAGNIEAHWKDGEPVIIKLFGDLDSQNPVFRQEEMIFEPVVRDTLIQWMEKPMVFIGYSFSDKIINRLLTLTKSNAPVFAVKPSPKTPAVLEDLDRFYHIQNDFSGFMQDLLKIIEELQPDVKQKMADILAPLGISSLDRPIPLRTDKVKRILILAANPKETPPLRLSEQVRDISEALNRANLKDYFEINSRWAVGYRHFRRALLDYNPHIVHFTGHGSEAGLVVEDEWGFPTDFSPEALAVLFKNFSKTVECVILNACYSAKQSKMIHKYIDYVIGIKKEIEDKAAIEFAVGFYDGLGAGKSYEESFELGKTAIQARFPNELQHNAPVILVPGN